MLPLTLNSGYKIVILSLNPRIPGDIFLEPGLSLSPVPDVYALINRAEVIFLKQSCRASLYHYCRSLKKKGFPKYDHRFAFPGKTGSIVLWKKMKVPYPKSIIFSSVSQFEQEKDKRDFVKTYFPLPWVIKSNKGGGGNLVYRVDTPEEITPVIYYFKRLENKGLFGFVIQEFIHHQGMELRVVVIGSHLSTYWRCQPDKNEFRNNVCCGASIHYGGNHKLVERSLEGVHRICLKSGINLAAFDIFFDFTKDDPEPVYNEINYNFGLQGLKGSRNFSKLLRAAADDFLSSL